MKIYPDRRKGEYPFDPIAEKLRTASQDEQGRVTGASDFASRLRARIESDQQSKVSLPTDHGVLHSRKDWRTWLAVSSAVAAAILVTALLSIGNQQPSANEIVLAPEVTDQFAGTTDALSELAEADVEIGLRLVNTSLGKTIQSVGSARAALREFLEPLQPSNPQLSNEQVAKKSPAGVFGVADDQLVAVFTEKVLGIRN